MEFLINMTVTFSVTTILILLIKLFFKNRLTPKWHVFIWVILIARLAIPSFPESDISIFNFIPDIPNMYADYIEGKTGSSAGGISDEMLTGQGTPKNNSGGNFNNLNSPSDNKRGESVFQIQEIKAEEQDGSKLADIIVWSLYGLGVLSTAAVFLISYNRLLKKISTLPVCCDERILTVFSACKEKAGLREAKLSVKQGASSPMLAGIWSPTVYISEQYNNEELKYVFSHELCHYKNRDLLWNLVSVILLCLNWFNPLAWYAVRVFRRDLEMYCDYRVINLTGEKKAYAEILLKTASEHGNLMVAAACLESGEKEVAQRIKRIASFKRPKMWMSIAGLVVIASLSVFCLTNAVELNGKTQIIGVCGPDNRWDSYSMEIPLSWAQDYEEKVSKEEPYNTSLIFHDEKGNEMAGLFYEKIDGAVQEISEKSLRQLIEKSPKFSRLADNKESNIKIEKIKEESQDIWSAYKVNYLNNTNIIRTEIYLAAEEHAEILPVLYKQSDKIDEEELVNAAITLQKIKEPDNYQPTAEAGMLTKGEKGFAVLGGEYDAKGLMKDYLDNYVNTPMPLSRAIKGYKLNSFEQIDPVRDIPSIVDEGMFEGELVPWNIIYPAAKVYKVDYELIPENIEKYKDVAGGGFEMTKTGNKHYIDRYAVFYGYSVDGKNYESVFIGFLGNSNLGEWGVDYSVLDLINTWYEEELLPKIYKNATVQYVGDASAVGKLVRLLPLHEYSNGIELQTKEEPYGVTVNYKIGRAEPYDAEKGGLLSSWPKEDGDLTGIYSQSQPQNFNRYIQRQITRNASWFLYGIQNVNTIHIKCESPYMTNIFYLDYTDPYRGEEIN